MLKNFYSVNCNNKMTHDDVIIKFDQKDKFPFMVMIKMGK